MAQGKRSTQGVFRFKAKDRVELAKKLHPCYGADTEQKISGLEGLISWLKAEVKTWRSTVTTSSTKIQTRRKGIAHDLRRLAQEVNDANQRAVYATMAQLLEAEVKYLRPARTLDSRSVYSCELSRWLGKLWGPVSSAPGKRARHTFAVTVLRAAGVTLPRQLNELLDDAKPASWHKVHTQYILKHPNEFPDT